MTPLQVMRIIVLLFGATVLLLAVRRLRAYRLKERHVLMFTFLCLPFLVLFIWPQAIGWLALKLGIKDSTVATLCLAAFFTVLVIELFTIVSLQERRISTLAQIVGIMMEKQGMGERRNGENGESENGAKEEEKAPPPPVVSGRK
jgi:small-conductance mechanosensitive channel